MRFRIFLLLLVFPCAAQAAGPFQRDVDFSKYNVPLYAQLVDRIKAKIAPRLGDEPFTADRYFIIPFAYEDRGNHPEFSHSFISVVRVFADNKPEKLTPGLKSGKYQGWDFEAFTISWLPADFLRNPHLCVFDGPGSRLLPKNNKCPISPGRNFNLADTIQLAVDSKNAVAMWGPYEIRKEGFDRGIARKKLLDSGSIKYRADDRLYQKSKIAISCFHAMASLDELFPKGGVFNSGFKIWGFSGTERVLLEYTKKPQFRALFLQPVDLKKDRTVWVYAPSPQGKVPYNPARYAMAYHR